MASKEDKQDQDDLSFLRTEDFICLNCSVTMQNGITRRLALSAEAFGNKMCFLEDISVENVTPNLPSCIFVLEQALSVRALQEVVNKNSESNANSIQQSGHKTLLYGHAVLLRHLQSNMYLTCLSTSSSNDKLAFDVGLQVVSKGESCWWTIHPASKQRSEGEKVRIGDDIILVSVASERYLHIYAIENNAIHRVNASFQQTLWTLLPISSGNVRMKNNGFVYGGDVLRLFHGNMDQCFTLPQPGVSEQPYNIFYETGSACNHARSLWRLEYLRTRWYGGFSTWNSFVRLRHVTSGRYLAVVNGEVSVIHRDKANADAITFILTPTKDDKRSTEEEVEDGMGKPVIKYGDTLVYMQHMKSSMWLSYQTYETKKRGVGKVEEKKASVHPEGHMDDCFTIVRAQDEEARSALVIRKCMSLFTKFIRAMDAPTESNLNDYKVRYWRKISLEKVLKCLEDMIEFFAQPNENCSHEERQNKLKILRNRQDLFHEEGMISLILETIDKYSETKDKSNKGNIQLFEGCKQEIIDDIYDQLYALLATMIKGNRNNCAQFAQGNRLDCLISRLTSQQTSRGVLEVLHCVLIDSPETLNMMKERHIQGIISLLDRNGRDPKVLSVLCALCANNSIAVRTNQNLICENLLPRRDLLLQSALIDQISCLRPNLMVGVNQGESMYKKWYFEVEIDFIEPLAANTPHFRIGWATTEFQPTPDGADGFSLMGVGDDVYSYGFDGVSLWFAGRNKVINSDEFTGFKKGDVIGCLLDLSIPEIWFSLNGVPMKGFFREFNLSSMFYPVVSVSPKMSCRFLFGDEHGRFKSGPPEGCAPIYQAMLQKQKIKIEPCFSYGDVTKVLFQGPPQPQEQIAFTPVPVDTSNIVLPPYIENVRDRLAENLHEIWSMDKIENGWRYSDFRIDNKKLHNCLCQFEMLPPDEKFYDSNLAMETLKTMFALGYQILLDSKHEQKRLKILKLPNTYMQINGYKPQPLDLHHITLTLKLEELVELLAENTHKVWAKEKIKNGWTYGFVENILQKRHPFLLPYDKVDPIIKKANKEKALDTVKTLLAYGYVIEPPALDVEEITAKNMNENKESHSQKFKSRTYRAEKTYSISAGKWYYEVEILSVGPIKLGWSSLDCSPNIDISHEANSYSFDCNAARKWHNTSEPFGKTCTIGDIVGVMIDMHDKTISFSLNGEFLMDSVGSETAFENINSAESFVPAFTLYSGQKIRANFGQNVNSLRYFINCGLQEGYEPFAVNMTRAITFWYSNEIPIFENTDDSHESLEITRQSSDSGPYIKLISKTFGSEKTKMEYLRLSLPVTFADEFVAKNVVKERKLNALNVYKSQVEEETGETGNMFNFDPPEIQIDADAKVDTNTTPIEQSNELAVPEDKSSKPLSSLFSKITHRQSKAKSPLKILNKLSNETSTATNKKLNQAANKSKISRSSEIGTKSGSAQKTSVQAKPKANANFFNNKSQANFDENYPLSDAEMVGETDDMEMQAIIDYVDEYYYGVRLFPGQDPSKVFIGWTTSRFHLLTNNIDATFDDKLVSKCTLINTSSDGSIISSLMRKDCYVISAAELNSNFSDSSGVASKRLSTSLLLGCIVDLSSGVLSFTVNGKESTHKFQVEPGCKLYPAVFVEPTTKEILQIELGRVKNCLPLSAGLFPSLGKNITPKFPPRLKLQYLKPIRWSRVPNVNLKVHTLKMNNVLGWSLLCEEAVRTQAIYIPEKDRWISILELNENEKLLKFYKSMIKLYEAVCDQSNNFVAHQVCKLIDENQLLYCVQNPYMSGVLRKGYHDLLIKLHLEAFVTARIITKHEFVIPLTEKLAENKLDVHENLQKGILPSRDDFVSVRPSIITEEDVKNESHRLFLVPPKLNLDSVRSYVLNAFAEAVRICASHIRDPIGGSNAFLFVPLIKLINQLLIIDIFDQEELNMILTYLEPKIFKAKDYGIEEGLLRKPLDDEVKYELCTLFHSICDYVMRYRIEAIINFSTDYVQVVQADQKSRYNELKESVAIIPSAVMARKTKEFRCPARDQMEALVNYKAEENSQIDLPDEIKSQLEEFHQLLNKQLRLKDRPSEEKSDDDANKSKGLISKVLKVLFYAETVNEPYANAIEAPIETTNPVENALVQVNSNEASAATTESEKHLNQLSQLIIDILINWGKTSIIYDQKLIREMFFLIYRQYNSLGEISDSLSKTYVISENSIKDVSDLLQSLSTIRSLLCVQMSACEEDIMKSCLNEVLDNRVFFQHPDLMRALCVHETVMQVMINWLNRRQHQQDVVTELLENSPGTNQSSANAGSNGDEAPKDENTELVVVCCKFLSYFCRTSRHNQRAMFEHLSYLLDNSGMLLARPSLRGSCPLDVACSSLMDNNDLSLALREADLEKIAAYLSRCGLQTNSELLAKGYPDIGWDPVEGERFLDFLKFCVWVNGDSVEENANLIVRLLIRRPECLGPALRGEGGGLLKAIIDGIKMSLQVAATQNMQNPIVMSAMLDVESELSLNFTNENKFDFSRIPPEDDEDYIDFGGAILSFYASLVELLGRCAPSEETIKMGKSDSIRARSILRSLVSMEDLQGVLGLRFILPIPQQPSLSEHLPGIQPSHKMSVVLFLDRVYGIPDQATFLYLLETCFLPDIRCATILDSSSCSEFAMALAINRYLCGSVLPLLSNYAHYFDASENKHSLMETVLNTVYRLSQCKSLTTGQLEIVCDFLIAFTNQMKPNMMRNLLKKLINDLPTLEEYTTVPLKMLTLWYERCSKYYSSSSTTNVGMQASEEEKRLTMTLFTRIFDALARRNYDPELFSKALPCLSAIGCALSPDYSYKVGKEQNVLDNLDLIGFKRGPFISQPINTATIILSNDFEEVIKIYSEHAHDYWCIKRFEAGWSYGDVYNDSTKKHPLLKTYPTLARKDQQKYEEKTRENLKVIKSLGWMIEKTETTTANAVKNASRVIFQKKVKDITNGFLPKPFDLSNITLTREQDELVVKMAMNCHDIWARRKRGDLENVGAELHDFLVPYDLLTDQERAKDLEFANELIKFLQLTGYRMQLSQESTMNENRHMMKSFSDDFEEETKEVRFAFNLLEKLLEYVDKAALNMHSIKESAKFSRKGSFRTSGQDIKFFTKVVLPLIEKYFQSHRAYFIYKSNSMKSSGAGFASSKEKEMTCSLFCKLALLMRKRLACFGSDTSITVRCLQVLIRAVDVSSVMKNSQEIVRASLLPFFSYAAEDLNNLIEDLKSSRLSNVKGTSQKTNSNLDYVNMVLLPVLASMFDHLGSNQYGNDVLVGEIQLASYKILNALWILGTNGVKLIDREWIISEFNRHRPLIGECLGSFASSFPIAFLESEYNLNNKSSIMYGLSETNLSEHSLEGQDVMNKLSKNLPSLPEIISEIGSLCESKGKYEQAPHIIEVLLPTVCSYLNNWWTYGPSARQAQEALALAKTSKMEKGSSVEKSTSHNHHHSNTNKKVDTSGKSNSSPIAALTFNEKSDGALLTGVTSEIMNQVLGYILSLISNNIEEREAPWMNRIAPFSQSIISNSTPDLLERNFLPVSLKIAEKTHYLYEREISLRYVTRNVDSSDRESIESDLQKEFEILVRNIYAFYPLLIKFVDLHKNFWLKNPDENSEKLYYTVADVFNIWLKSKMFKREEENFVSANDIDNMILIMPNKVASNLSNPNDPDSTSSMQSSSNERKNGKKRKKNPASKKFTSLIVASLKRLIQMGINLFEGKEQELIQMAKQKFIDIKTGNETVSSNVSTALVKAAPNSNAQGSNDENSHLELSKDQEDVVMEFIKKYLKSSEEMAKENRAAHELSKELTEAIDKEAYQKNNWQRMLYRKITSKRNQHQSGNHELVIQRIIDIAKVLFGLHMVEHPQTKSIGTWRKLISGQRKKAVMACFRMAPLYSIPHHKAINLFLKSYKKNWLENETENDTDIGSLIPDLCPQVSASEEVDKEEAASLVEKSGEENKDAENQSTPYSDIFESGQTPDPLRQLITSFNRAATTESMSTGANNLSDDQLYLVYADIMSKSCEIIDDDDEEEEGGGGDGEEEDQANTFQEQEMQKQKLLFEQGRLSERGAAEMTLLYISASKGEKSEMLEKTLQLGISLLHGGNINVQQRMLKHLKEKKDVGFFTSLAGLMANCTVLDLDTFERCIKAEQFGGATLSDGSSGMAGKKNLHDADFTCSLFRFLQLLCEGHNLDFQNYLRAQVGNNTTVNTIICTVDYLLRLQESIMDFYWHYSGKSTVDAAGRDNFCKAITVASQVFNTLTEYIQGPCVGNQLTLAHSRLWDAIGGFLYIFANLQDKLSKDPQQIDLLKELMNLQKDMIIMLLSMLEGNVLNGPIGKQMVDTLIENQQNVEMLLKFFDIFLKMKDITTSESFREFDSNGDGWISPKEFKKAMEAQKMYSNEEIDYILLCVDTNQDGKIDFNEFTQRFHDPSKDIGFNMAVLLTNLSEHMSHDARFERLMKKASSFLSYFEPFLGRIEITGSSGRIERVYFEIKESNIEQWNKPQIKESKRQFLYDIVNEGDDKEKLEVFVNFCEDTIFEMQHAASISSSTDEDNQTISFEAEKQSLLKQAFESSKYYFMQFFQLFSPTRWRNAYSSLTAMSKSEFFKFILNTNISIAYLLFSVLFYVISLCVKSVYLMVVGANNLKDADKSLKNDEQSGKHMRNANGSGLPDFNEDKSIFKPFGLATIDKLKKANEPHRLDTVQEVDSENKELLSNELEVYNYGTTDPNTQTPVDETPKTQESTQFKSRIRTSYLKEEDESAQSANEDNAKSGSNSSKSSNTTKRILSLFARNFYKLKYLALILAFLINFCMLFYKAKTLGGENGDGDGAGGGDDDAGDQEELLQVIMMDPDEYYIEYILKGLALVHSIVAFALMVAYYVLKVPLVIFKREKEVARKLEFQGMWIVEQPSDDDLRSHWDKLVLSTPTYPEMYWDKFIKKKVKSKYAEQFDLQQLCKLLGISATADEYKIEEASDSSAKAENGGLFSRFSSIDWSYQIWKWGVIFTDNSFLYVFWYFCFSVIGNFNYFFFACHLSDIAVSIKSLTTILKSITHNGKQLLLTIMLMSVIVYGYTVIAFNFFRKFYTKEEEGEVEENCQDLFTCFKFHLYIGIRSGGGIGDELESPVGDSKEFFRIIFDITFFFFIIVILLAIIQGLIIDAFGELRDQLEQVKESLEASCFICGIGKEYFDKMPHGFEIHTMREHNFANYMFFLMHLINKPDTEYTGQETYVWQQYQQRCWEFFPAGDCFRKQHETELEQS